MAIQAARIGHGYCTGAESAKPAGRRPDGLLQRQSLARNPAEPSRGKAPLLTLICTVNGAIGSALDRSAAAVDHVLGEQFARLASYIETGKPAAP